MVYHACWSVTGCVPCVLVCNRWCTTRPVVLAVVKPLVPTLRTKCSVCATTAFGQWPASILFTHTSLNPSKHTCTCLCTHTRTHAHTHARYAHTLSVHSARTLCTLCTYILCTYTGSLALSMKVNRLGMSCSVTPFSLFGSQHEGQQVRYVLFSHTFQALWLSA